jgi:CO/xanthine dehydrogenase FAD-binding subunit
MLLSHAQVYRANTLTQALELRTKHPTAQIIAGGTDIMVMLSTGAIQPPAFLDLWKLRELNWIKRQGDLIGIGALSTFTDLLQSELLRTHSPMLLEAARSIGARQIQNRGTIGGNIANASPAGDTLPALLALDAQIEVASLQRGSRRIPMHKLYTAYRQTALEPDEIITTIWLPIAHAQDRTMFRKIGTRQAQAISKVVFAGRLRLDHHQTICEARIAFGSVAPTPIRCHHVEQALTQHKPDPSVVSLLPQDIKPIDDIRSNSQYRLLAAQRLLQTWLQNIQ